MSLLLQKLQKSLRNGGFCDGFGQKNTILGKKNVFSEKKSINKVMHFARIAEFVDNVMLFIYLELIILSSGIRQQCAKLLNIFRLSEFLYTRKIRYYQHKSQDVR